MLIGAVLLAILLYFMIDADKSKVERISSFIFSIVLYSISTLFFWQKFNYDITKMKGWVFPVSNVVTQLVLSLISVIVIWVYFYIKEIVSNSEKFSYKQVFFLLVRVILVFLGTISLFSSYWAMHYFGNIKFDQIMFTISQPLTGTNVTQITDYIKGPLLLSLMTTFWLVALGDLLFLCAKKLIKNKRLINTVYTFSTILFIVSSFAYSLKLLGFNDIKAYFFETTKMYDSYYVDPRDVSMTFPENKRNLIYIFLESMESSYSSKEYGGIESENLIPNLTNEALNEGVNFSNRTDLGGMITIPGANQTVSSMFAQTSGIPLRTSGSIDENSYRSTQEYFMPGAYTLGEILQDQGYNQMLFIGSQGTFGGRDKYFKQHGNYTIRDYYWFKKEGIIPDDYYVWWGVEDEKIFPYAKESLSELASADQPFNFTMLTTNTHFEDGFKSAATPYKFTDQYSNVIYYSDYLVEDLLQWIKQQDFYQNTTVIVVGDHLTMDKDFFENIDPNYQRTAYNVILNAPTTIQKSNHSRLFNATDLFPTTLAALDVSLSSDRLGIGTNLYSNTPTLMEEMGQQKYVQEVAKKSEFYNKTFIKDAP